MKSFGKMICIILLGLQIAQVQAQYSFDMFGVVPVSKLNNGAFGLGLSILSNPIPFNPSSKKNSADILFGGNFYGSGLDNRVLKNVPLQAPREGFGQVTIKNSIYGLSAITRVSIPITDVLRAYIGAQIGWRGLSSDLTILPNTPINGSRNQSSQHISSSDQLSYGLSAGFLVELEDGVSLDLGATYNTTNTQSSIINLDTAHVDSNSLVVDKMSAPSNLLMVKVGFFITIDKDAKGSSRNSCSRHSNSHHSSYRSGGSSHVSVIVR